MKEILLKPERLGMVALVDDEDYERLHLMGWRYYKTKGRNTGYGYLHMEIEGKMKRIAMHRFILDLTDPKIHVDHIDHDGLNNQKSNLRIVDNRLNHHNRRNQGKSYLVGACWDKARNKWISYIRLEGRKTYIGRFNTEEEAHRAYMKRVEELASPTVQAS